MNTLFTPGPILMDPETLIEGGKQAQYFRTPAFSEKMLECMKMLQEVLGASHGTQFLQTDEWKYDKVEELREALDELETTVEYDGSFCSIQDAVAIVVLGSLCELKSVMKIHAWATSDNVKAFLKTHFGIEHIPCYGTV